MKSWLAVVCLVAVGCSTGELDSGTASTPASLTIAPAETSTLTLLSASGQGETLPHVVVQPCADICVPTIDIGANTFRTTCREVRGDLISERQAAKANPDVGIGDVYHVDGHPVLLAVELPLGSTWCPTTGVFIGAFRFDDDHRSNLDTALGHARADCEAFEDVPAICADGGNARAALDRPDVVGGSVYAYFPEVVAAIDTEVGLGEGPVWRADPDAVVRQWFEREQLDSLCDDRTRDWQYACRIGGRWDDDTFVLRYQTLVAVNDPPIPMFEGADYVITLEQLGGGPSWWVTSYAEHSLVEIYSTLGDPALAAWDTMWDGCCEQTWVEWSRAPEPTGLPPPMTDTTAP